MKKVSVVIPVYNSEKFLNQCLDSVCGQTLKEIEIICVDDGSTDRSTEILKEYAEKDDRVQILTQKNSGSAMARNNGLAKSSGKYVIFWDSDDYFEKDALEKLYDRCEQEDADICICGANKVDYETGDVWLCTNTYLNEKRVPAPTFSPMENQKFLFCFTCEAVWNKFFRRSFLKENNLKFPKFSYNEDTYLCLLTLLYAGRITILPTPLVHYRANNPNSLVTSSKPRDAYESMRYIQNALKKSGKMTPELWQSFRNRVITNLLLAMRRHPTFKEYEESFQCVKQEAVPEFELDRLLEPEYAFTKNILERYTYFKQYDAGSFMLWFAKHIEKESVQRQNVILRKTKDIKSLKKEKEAQAAKLKKITEEKKVLAVEKKFLADRLKRTEKELRKQTQQLEKITSSTAYKLMSKICAIKKFI